MNCLVTFFYIIFHFNNIYSTKKCPTITHDIPKSKSADWSFQINCWIYLTNSTPSIIDESNKAISYLVDYNEAKVFTKHREINIYYPLERIVTNRCPFSRFLTVTFKCPGTAVNSKK
ncbi:hypothetical protein MXB_4856, partial [Myxobolus squamalis]